MLIPESRRCARAHTVKCQRQRTGVSALHLFDAPTTVDSQAIRPFIASLIRNDVLYFFRLTIRYLGSRSRLQDEWWRRGARVEIEKVHQVIGFGVAIR